MNIKIALLQIAGCGTDKAANQEKGEAFCRHAHAMGADIALFPEMWSVGYTPVNPAPSVPPDLWKVPERWAEISPSPIPDLSLTWKGQAISRKDLFIVHFQALARELNMAIALTYLEEWPGAPRNAVSLIDRRGDIVMTYAKIHTCDFDGTEASLTPGDDFFVCSLDTAQGMVNVGAMICYDREFPESARILMLKGAEVILVPNACPLGINRLAQFRARAYENMVGLAMTNYAAPQNNGHSLAFDGIGYGKEGERDMLVVEAGEHEGVYLATFDLNALRDFRMSEVMGNAYRRPHRYGALVSLDVAPPFVRVNAQGKQYDRSQR